MATIKEDLDFLKDNIELGIDFYEKDDKQMGKDILDRSLTLLKAIVDNIKMIEDSENNS